MLEVREMVDGLHGGARDTGLELYYSILLSERIPGLAFCTLGVLFAIA